MTRHSLLLACLCLLGALFGTVAGWLWDRLRFGPMPRTVRYD